MIVTIAELKLFANWTTPSKQELAVLNSIHVESEAAVKNYLNYDPVQREHTEFYPRHLAAGGPGLWRSERWQSNSTGTQAVLASRATLARTLQLQHIPVRSVTDVRVDTQGKHGSPAGAFAAGTAWTAGTDYWMEAEQDEFCASGCLFTSRSWPLEPGTVKVTYRAGYSFDELNGRAAASQTINGVITTQGIDASGIKKAVILTVIKAIHTWQAFRRSDAGSFIPGGLKSERLQDYSYTLSDTSSNQATSMLVNLPTEAIEALDPYRNYGVLRL